MVKENGTISFPVYAFLLVVVGNYGRKCRLCLDIQRKAKVDHDLEMNIVVIVGIFDVLCCSAVNVTLLCIIPSTGIK